jgi:hypothetical protein
MYTILLYNNMQLMFQSHVKIASRLAREKLAKPVACLVLQALQFINVGICSACSLCFLRFKGSKSRNPA